MSLRITLKLVLILLVAGASVSACQRRAPQAALGEDALDAGPLLPVEAMGPDFFEEQDVHLQWPGSDLRVRAVLQKRDGILELITLDPRARPILKVTHDDAGVHIEEYADRSLPFEASYIVADVQKAFARWPLEASPDLESGIVSGEHQSLRYEEEREDGRIVQRRFWRSDLPDDKQVVVHYAYADESGSLREVRVDNGWFGYVLAVRILRRELL